MTFETIFISHCNNIIHENLFLRTGNMTEWNHVISTAGGTYDGYKYN